MEERDLLKSKNDLLLSQLADSEKESLRLAKQVDQMTQFLADYGMTWVGEAASKENSSASDEQQASGASKRGIVILFVNDFSCIV